MYCYYANQAIRDYRKTSEIQLIYDDNLIGYLKYFF